MLSMHEDASGPVKLCPCRRCKRAELHFRYVAVPSRARQVVRSWREISAAHEVQRGYRIRRDARSLRRASYYRPSGATKRRLTSGLWRLNSYDALGEGCRQATDSLRSGAYAGWGEATDRQARSGESLDALGRLVQWTTIKRAVWQMSRSAQAN